MEDSSLRGRQNEQLARMRAAASLRRTIRSWTVLIERNRTLAEEVPAQRAMALAQMALAEAYRGVDLARLERLEQELGEESRRTA
jgi:hypothetical protein